MTHSQRFGNTRGAREQQAGTLAVRQLWAWGEEEVEVLGQCVLWHEDFRQTVVGQMDLTHHAQGLSVLELKRGHAKDLGHHHLR